jgi:hypothetical protein
MEKEAERPHINYISGKLAGDTVPGCRRTE